MLHRYVEYDRAGRVVKGIDPEVRSHYEEDLLPLPAACNYSTLILFLPICRRYVEYDRAGRVVKGIEAKVRSRYEEDVFPGNHTSVWGSWWADGSWGYACCHSCVKGSYCVGASGREAAVQQAAQMAANMEAKAREAEAEELK